MRDTAHLGVLQEMFVNKFTTPSLRTALLRSWASGPTLLPKGGTPIWGTTMGKAFAVDDSICANGNDTSSFANMVTLSLEDGVRALNVLEAIDLIRNITDADYKNLLDKYYSFGLDVNPMKTQSYRNKPRTWTNPLESALPNAPNMTIYCFYGVGKPTERAYYYTKSDPQFESALDGKEYELKGPSVPYRLDNVRYSADCSLTGGVQDGEGDGTVPLLSLGYMCVEGWSKKEYNPGGVKVVTREYQHKPLSPVFDPRGGGQSGDHVDIMGNNDMIEDVLRVAAGQKLSNRIYSSIREFSALIKLTPQA